MALLSLRHAAPLSSISGMTPLGRVLRKLPLRLTSIRQQLSHVSVRTYVHVDMLCRIESTR